MLVLTRKTGQSVVIGDGITVVVLGVNGGQVRLGFEAPKKTNIVRSELLKESTPVK